VDPTINRLLLGYHAPVEGKAELQGGSSDPSRGGDAFQWSSRLARVCFSLPAAKWLVGALRLQGCEATLGQ
jgi:hypothetical protein